VPALTRRRLLGAVGLGAVSTALTACAHPTSPRATPAADVSADDPTLVWTGGSFTLDEDEQGRHPTLDRFTATTGIAVEYREDIDDDNVFTGKYKDRLGSGRDIGSDLVCLSDGAVARWVQRGYARPLTPSSTPNRSRLRAALKVADFDPGREHSLPWLGGITGVCWNRDALPRGVASVSDLWKPEHHGRIGVLSDFRDSVGLIMLEQGVDISAPFTSQQYDTALDVLREHLHSGHIRTVKGASYTAELVAGRIDAAIARSNDIATLNQLHGDRWGFVVPAGGGALWNQNFVVPLGSRRASNAERLIDFYYDPELAAEAAAWTNCIPPVEGVAESAARIDPELARNQWIFPSDEILDGVRRFRTLSPAEEHSFGLAFQGVLLGT
jgi:spermidine/putrescine transport system substrate-binding protein